MAADAVSTENTLKTATLVRRENASPEQHTAELRFGRSQAHGCADVTVCVEGTTADRPHTHTQ